MRTGADSGAVPAAVVKIVAALAILFMCVTAFGEVVKRPDVALVKSDFSAFYCGAVVTLAHKDPYALSPLRACEAERVDIPGGADPAVIGVNPDPMPGYGIAVFAPLTWLSYRAAALVWDVLLVAAIAGTAVLMASMTGLPFIVVLAILAYADGAAILPYGQLPPILTFGLTLAAYGLVRERRTLVFFGAALAMMEPHVGLPACCAIFVWRPGLRLGLAGVAIALGALSVIVLGVPLNREYLLVELPAHVNAEATTSIQYSLALLLHYFGLADAVAIRLGSVQYALFAFAAVVLSGRVAQKLDTPAAIPLFPAAVALIGGTYVHLLQMGAAIPFALLVATRLRGAAAATAWFAIALLAVPWPSGSRLLTLEVSAIIATIVFVASRNQRMAFSVCIALVGAVLYAVFTGPVLTNLVPSVPRHVVGPAAPMPRALDGDRLASEEDALEIRTGDVFAVATPRTLAAKLPTWFALSAIALLGLGATGTRRLPQPAPI